MWEFLRTGRKCLLLETNKFSFCLSLYIYSIYSRNISWTPTICRHYDKHSDNGEQTAFTIYNVSPVCLAIGSPWESDHGKMVFLELWCSRLDPGPWNVVPLTSEEPVSLFLRSSFPLANCNTNCLNLWKRKFHLFSINEAYYFHDESYFKESSTGKTWHYLFLIIVVLVTEVSVPRTISICTMYVWSIHRAYLCVSNHVHTHTHTYSFWIFFLK